ncbi:MAG: triose-phosphate isomerase [Candidatus Handelsmanbacteria bacterium RIFCSPLOWO2_12_FULL_64_10]|uniref:Triosephosphate isomerase n=1 Tax=Handelsmanbacteria sp. (strain RIFCSPLOWO2_12_FULL_64_10) TaxID=1817868 RepID=A0A1F6C3B3_HANXR|nr:MAG: triose-phosphate isomerase [Candidatus Handelsmanbacteria bacterium RIFCSPLOWO2_12_FULL_64_10]
MRTPIVAGNWKMNRTVEGSLQLIAELLPLLKDSAGVEVVLCPPFTSLWSAHQALRASPVGLGGQDMHWEASGAYTGEVSAEMLLTCGCRYVILGHSERRAYFGETDETVNRKTLAALKAGLLPIVCVGETLQERQGNVTQQVVGRQVRGAFKGVQPADVSMVIVAYEPVWAIGTGLTATPTQAQEVHAFIRSLLTELYDTPAAASVRIQYGGSVKPDNAGELFAQPDIDGGLIGGASLQAGSFAAIVKACET